MQQCKETTDVAHVMHTTSPQLGCFTMFFHALITRILHFCHAPPRNTHKSTRAEINGSTPTNSRTNSRIVRDRVMYSDTHRHGHT